MRDLTRSEKNKLTIHDARSGTDIELYYRNPTTQEEVQYQSKSIKRIGRKIVVNTFETRLEMGLQILTGFREGDFGFDGKPISSDPASPNYREDWKELLKENAADIIATFAFTIFEGTRTSDSGIDFEIAGEEDIVPFRRSSGD